MFKFAEAFLDGVKYGIMISFFLFPVLIMLNGSCGPQFDREAMQDVKETFCAEVLEEAELAKQRGDALTPEESAAVEFCDE
jgi:hypothetical protein